MYVCMYVGQWVGLWVGLPSCSDLVCFRGGTYMWIARVLGRVCVRVTCGFVGALGGLGVDWGSGGEGSYVRQPKRL